MCYSASMETNTAAPDLTFRYPSKGKKIGPAWQAAWNQLLQARKDGEGWVDGTDILSKIDPKLEMSPDTLRALLYRMVNGDILERDVMVVDTDKGPRAHTHFRIREEAMPQ